jgi:hypothetical protein
MPRSTTIPSGQTVTHDANGLPVSEAETRKADPTPTRVVLRAQERTRT